MSAWHYILVVVLVVAAFDVGFWFGRRVERAQPKGRIAPAPRHASRADREQQRGYRVRDSNMTSDGSWYNGPADDGSDN